MPALKSLRQITLTGVAVGLQKALVTFTEATGHPSHPRRAFTSLEITLFQHMRPFLSVKGEVVFLLMDLEYSLPAAGFICMAKAEQKEGSELVCEVFVCPSVEPGLMLLPQPTLPRMEDLAERVGWF